MRVVDLEPEDDESGDVRVIVETPKGSRNKFKYLPEHDLFAVNRVIPAGMMFPFNFGFVPSTLAEDCDPLDALVLTTDPVPVGCMVLVRLIGVIEGTQREGRARAVRNDRLIAVGVEDAAFGAWRRLDDVDDETLQAIEQFFVSYHKVQGRTFTPLSRGGPKKAHALLRSAVQLAGRPPIAVRNIHR
jgi:inorganic pyrophosphatase